MKLILKTESPQAALGELISFVLLTAASAILTAEMPVVGWLVGFLMGRCGHALTIAPNRP